MTGERIIKSLYNLVKVYLQIEDKNSKELLQEEILLLVNDLDQATDVPDDVKHIFVKMLKQYFNYNISRDLIEKTEAEEKLEELKEEFKHFLEKNKNE